MAIVAHHRIANAPPKKAKPRGMSVTDAAEHFAKTEAIKKARAKRKAQAGQDV